MFWGLIMEPGKRYTQKVERAFHVSMACLEPSSADNENVSVMLSFDKTEFILCNLNKHKVIQTQLDLNFQSGDKIAFMSSGKGRVHLTGYLLETDEEDDEDDDEDDEEKDMTNGMSVDSSDSFTKKASNTSKESGKRKNEPQLSKPESKKAKLEQPESDEDKSLDMDDDDDDDDDDEDDELGESDDMLEGSEDEDDDDDDEEDEDDDSESEDEKMVSISKQKPESKKNKTMSPKEMQPNKSLIKQNKSPNEKEQKSGFFEKHQKAKTPNEKQQQQQQKQKIKTPNEKLQTSTPKSSPGAQVNGLQSGKKNKKGFDTPKGAKTPNAESPQKKVLEGGVMVEDVRVGNGPVAKPGRQVSVYYVGRLRNNNKQFDSTTEGSGFKFRLGRGEVIKGWDIGVSGMKVGGKRKIVCPPALAYGNKGSPPAIPPNSTLVFEVELKSVN